MADDFSSGYSLVPVDYQPEFEGVTLVPVDHNPFSADSPVQQAGMQPQSAPQQSGNGAAPITASGGDSQSFGKSFLQGAINAVPGAYYSGLAQQQFRQGNYGAAALYGAESLGDAALGIATLGAATRWGAAARAAETMVPAAAESVGLGRTLPGAAARVAESPQILPEELAGRTRSQIQDLAADKGLVPKGDPLHPDYPRRWSDPVTNKRRLRLDRGHVEAGQPYDMENAAVDHVHGYDINGNPIEINGDKHVPTTGE